MTEQVSRGQEKHIDYKIPFSLEMLDNEHDMNTFKGRWNHFICVSNIFHAFQSKEKIQYYQTLLKIQEAKENQQLEMTGSKQVMLTKIEIDELRLAKQVLSFCVNPDTEEIIPWSMRMSSYIPLNIPISYGLVITPPTPLNTIVWQFINQTYNA